MKNAIIYLHGFNSASKDLSGKLLTSKQKLVVLDEFCRNNDIVFDTPNVDYRDFDQLIGDLTQSFNALDVLGYRVLFMGSSMGGFTSEYMAMKLQTKAVMINPAIIPSVLLTQFIGVSENFETNQAYDWREAHCEQFKKYELELEQYSGDDLDRTLFLDMADELIDSFLTLGKYKNYADVYTYPEGSHSFEHIEEAMPVIEKLLLD